MSVNLKRKLQRKNFDKKQDKILQEKFKQNNPVINNFVSSVYTYYSKENKPVTNSIVLELFFQDVNNQIKKRPVLFYDGIPVDYIERLNVIEVKLADLVTNFESYINPTDITKNPKLIGLCISYFGYINKDRNHIDTIYRGKAGNLPSTVKPIMIVEYAYINGNNATSYLYLNSDHRVEQKQLYNIDTPAVFANSFLSSLLNYFG